ncbi:hypothetical protein J1G42_13035 [Cellulomonas sp. zg-ZUI222]|uniref:Integral membrane protein n=1 Tax=Cellulomonas wangleii TaxID=2816956 RepID=A0ABX8D6B5_9CELL|nr:hypothetical protein [Cellulomonas wangleii]MBO0921748.1 hypothetical protein [Cellulomonas wangleii]MBO0924830.1 hypothetical protein [Cellulomonas wangleii]QVI62998.1 hypothetical protein KG103_03485 [Cellulomonas wangleii]
MHVTSDLRTAAGLHARAPVTGALGAAVAVASIVLGAQGRVLLHQCVTADGPLASLGVRLAVLRSAAECPDGTLGLGPASHGAVLLLSVAAPVVAAHLLLTAAGLGLGVVARRGLRAAARVAARLLPVPATTGLPAVPTRASAVPTGPPARVRRDRRHDPARPRRGPPAH